MTTVALIGGSGGIGQAMVSEMSQMPAISAVHATYFNSIPSSALESHASWTKLDATNASQLASWMSDTGQVDWIINCAGFLHDVDKKDGRGSMRPEKSLSQFDVDYFNHSMQINCLPTLLLAKHAVRNLKQSDNPVLATISARVGSISDNRLGGWYSYRASKAALNMAIKSISIEYQRTAPSIKVLALHPGTTDTALSKPFQSNVPEGKLFSPEKTASLLLAQIADASNHASGRFIAFDGSEIPW